MHRIFPFIVIIASCFSGYVQIATAAFPIATLGTEGFEVIVKSTGPVVAAYQGKAALTLFSNDLYLMLDQSGNPGDDGNPANDLFIFSNHTSPVGSKVTLGSFPAGTELIFRLHANDTGEDYFTGQASRNPDNKPHARALADWLPEEILVSFEDYVDFLYNNLSFSLIPTLAQEIVGLLFFEPFENLSTVQGNGGGAGTTGWPTFTTGVVGNGADFTGSRSVCYPLSGNFDLHAGTLEFWVKPPPQEPLGFFDIGTLGLPNSWGIFLNSNHLIMEVKNQYNEYAQAWSPEPIGFDGGWHYVATVWERNGETTSFKVCWDGVCKSQYDGRIHDSFPDLSGEFCVGWNGWYGYSESVFDEFQIYGRAKSDEEIAADFHADTPP